MSVGPERITMGFDVSVVGGGSVEYIRSDVHEAAVIAAEKLASAAQVIIDDHEVGNWSEYKYGNLSLALYAYREATS